MRKPPQTSLPPIVRLYEVTEELRDLVSAVWWLVDMKSDDPLYRAERERVVRRLNSAKELVTKLDHEEVVRENQWGDDDKGEDES